MADMNLPQELLEARAGIDEIDSKLISLLAERFALTLKVGEIKAEQALESMDPGREAQKIEKLRQLSIDTGLNPDLVEGLFTAIMREVVKNHQQLKQSRS